MTTLTLRGAAQLASLNIPRIPRAVTMRSVAVRRVAVHRVMVARKRMRRRILTINSEFVEERILRGQGPRILHYSTVFYKLSVTSVIPLVTYYVIS
jgi:hypothetical protein